MFTLARERNTDPARPALRRLKWVVAGGAACWLVLVGRLVQVQAFRHAEYAARAEQQHLRPVELKAKRGSILDRRGDELALDIQTASFYADPAVVEHPEEVAGYFAGFSKDPEAYANLQRQLRSAKRFVYLARQLDEETAGRIRQQGFAGVFEFAETKRYCPSGSLAAQLIGYTNIDNQGNEGVEMACDTVLGGVKGAAVSYVDARGAPIPGRQEEHRMPQDGCSVRLTIDGVYQDILEAELNQALESCEGESGLGIITAPKTGEILAMANAPFFDRANPGASPPWMRRNRVVTDPFEPGSTFKAITAAALLDDGAVELEERVFCENGRFTLPNGDVVRDSHPLGWLTFREVIGHSSNIGTMKTARRLQRRKFYEYIRNFGFGTRTGIELPSESAGLLRHAAQWSDRSLETIAMGQEISVTALQLAMAVGAIANGGTLMAPRLIKEIIGPDGRTVRQFEAQAIRRVISPEAAAQMRQVLAGVVTEGTGKRAQVEGVTVAGKTGTAQRVAPGGQGYAAGQYVVSFVGFLPVEDPQLLCLVVVDNPKRDKWGAAISAPAFKRVMERILCLSDGVLARHGAPEPAGGDTLQVAVPDLRGMTRQVARFQAGLRGLQVRFEGTGEVVVAQSPPADSSGGELGEVTCLLGEEVQPDSAGELSAATQRQLLMLRSLPQKTQLAAVQ
jgi:cell division protein FtsI (penicillin-binding protein 3)